MDERVVEQPQGLSFRPLSGHLTECGSRVVDGDHPGAVPALRGKRGAAPCRRETVGLGACR
ncbi:hypothetical protein RHCRD62_10553 [Rhodococcus sp. RD6.2]|nr:hypothetical protein RHCRD62_10553 [Rhodococcus sp. RD6.2]